MYICLLFAHKQDFEHNTTERLSQYKETFSAVLEAMDPQESEKTYN